MQRLLTFLHRNKLCNRVGRLAIPEKSAGQEPKLCSFSWFIPPQRSWLWFWAAVCTSWPRSHRWTSDAINANWCKFITNSPSFHCKSRSIPSSCQVPVPLELHTRALHLEKRAKQEISRSFIPNISQSSIIRRPLSIARRVVLCTERAGHKERRSKKEGENKIAMVQKGENTHYLYQWWSCIQGSKVQWRRTEAKLKRLKDKSMPNRILLLESSRCSCPQDCHQYADPCDPLGCQIFAQLVDMTRIKVWNLFTYKINRAFTEAQSCGVEDLKSFAM